MRVLFLSFTPKRTNQICTDLSRHSHSLGLNINLITNGDGETGPCEGSGGDTPPTGWDYIETITQIAYSNLAYGDVGPTDPGPR